MRYMFCSNSFTFQYGSTLMAQQNQARFTTHDFTFQYGSTLISAPRTPITHVIVLYIPIWFYFNMSHEFGTKLIFNLYIPIWFYFNHHALNLLWIIRVLYIPIWFYFNRVKPSKIPAVSIFTFQYGSTLILKEPSS